MTVVDIILKDFFVYKNAILSKKYIDDPILTFIKERVIREKGIEVSAESIQKLFKSWQDFEIEKTLMHKS